jgi:phage shock protein E
MVVIDVRSEREFHATAIEHAVSVPLPQLAQRIGEIAADKATPLVLYCASGARSGIGCGVLKQLGYTHVTNAGGLYAAAESLQREVRR